MIHVKPFAALRPAAAHVDQVVCGKHGSNLHFGNVIRSLVGITLRNHSEEDYREALHYFEKLQAGKVLVRENKEGVYIYKQTLSDGKEFHGIVACLAFEDYINGDICKHENTLTSKQNLMVKHIEAIQKVGEPVLLANPNDEFMSDWIQQHENADIVFEFSDNHGKHHELWFVSEYEALENLKISFLKTPRLYIADGHHRIASVASYLKTNADKSQRSGIMSYILPESSLQIKPFHRILKHTDREEWLDMIHNASADFYVDLLSKPCRPEKKGDIISLTPMGWYRLRLKPGHTRPNPSENLDVFRLEEYVFKKFFHINDSKNDSRLEFVRGDEDLHSLEIWKNRGEIDGAFILYPNTIKEIKDVADAGETMPPKSTWIEPKIPAGMLINIFE
ncbi:MAG: DUF1015 domain-containing protein [Bacteroidetes bacterium]|nr:DUF1015 domain-containing protein [Bacteroidota bacterium]